MLAVLSGVLLAPLAVAGTWVDIGTFAVAAAIVLAGAVGVVVARNPVHAALMLVMTLFGIAVLFVAQRDDFLAVVQVIVYAGAIVVLFLFVIMFLGIDKTENLSVEPLRGQRPLAVGLVALGLTGVLLLGELSSWTTGKHQVAGPANGPGSNVAKLGQSVFTTYLFPFEVTSALLVIAVVGAVVLARRPPATGDERQELPLTDTVVPPDPFGGEPLAGAAAEPGGRRTDGVADGAGTAGEDGTEAGEGERASQPVANVDEEVAP